jgi:hypothetical protein
MESPTHVLPDGTQIITHDALDPPTGLIIKQRHLDARRASAPGIIRGWVPGHGGDVYWVEHKDETVAAAYCFTEFELVNATDIQRHKPALERAVEALQGVLLAEDPADMVSIAASTLGKLGAPLPDGADGIAKQIYEEAR